MLLYLLPRVIMGLPFFLIGGVVGVRVATPFLFVEFTIPLKIEVVNTKNKVYFDNIFRVDFFTFLLYNRNIQQNKKRGFYMWKYKIDILKELSNKGYTSTRLRNEKIISEGTMQHIRNGKGISTDTLNTVCLILRCQPSDIIEIIPNDEEKIKYF